ncbi:MAG: InlB B-repeat-containing protein [Sphaerochaetaceae bacterium]|nr:InlB B-repeat-containing protein [Sphaerochaetaceae bacterium]
MKKVIYVILTIGLLLGLFVSCNPDTPDVKFTVHFDTNGHGQNMDVLFVNGTPSSSIPAILEDDGEFIFGGWYTEKECEHAWDLDVSKLAASDVTFYAKWTEREYAVSFSLNGKTGTAPTAQSLKKDAKVTAPEAPTTTGYTFAGWYTDENCENAYDFDSSVVDKAFTLYAKWTVNNYSVSFNLKGHGSAIDPVNAVFGTKITAPTAPTETGYTFGGWYTDSAFTTAWSFDTPITGDITLYARWGHSVTFNMKNHGTAIETVFVPLGTTYTAPEVADITGYTFGGWYADERCNTPWSSTEVERNITLYAKWENIPYTVTLVSAPNSYIPESVVVKYNYKVFSGINPSVNRSYTIDGFYRDADYTDPWNLSTDVVTEDITLYVKCIPARYTVTYVMNGHGDQIAPSEHSYWCVMSNIPSPIADGYVFQGWYQDAELKTAWKRTDVVQGDMTLYAKWMEATGISTEEQLIDALRNGADNSAFALAGDIVLTAGNMMEADSCLVMPASKTITLDLNGHVIDANQVARVMTVYGKINIVDTNPEAEHPAYASDLSFPNGGVICNGNTSANGGAFNVVYSGDSDKNSRLNLQGGTIYKCHAAGNGGAVNADVTYSSSNASTTKTEVQLKNAKIINCTAGKNGGGVFIGQIYSYGLDGMNISGCTAENGGGIYTKYRRDPSMQHLRMTITDCHATAGNGGAIYSTYKLYIYSLIISDCSASNQGGAIYVSYSTSSSSYYTQLSGAVITNCRALESHGGAIYCTGNDLWLWTSTISGCEAGGYGGAICFGDNSTRDKVLLINRTSISDCHADNGFGGAIYEAKASKIAVEGSTITSCSAKQGGGIYILNASTILNISEYYINESKSYYSSISSCSAQSYGGAVLTKGTMSMTGNSSITDNTCGNEGGAIQVDNGATLKVADKAIISGNLLTGTTTLVNVRLNTDANRIVVDGELDADAYIGVTTEARPTSAVEIAVGNTTIPTGAENCFHADLGAGYEIVKAGENSITLGPVATV